MATYSDYAQHELDAASFAQDDKRRAAPAPPARRPRLPTVTVPRETELDDEIKDAMYDACADAEGSSDAYYLRHHLAQRGLLIVEAHKHSAALLRSQLVESTVATLKKWQALGSTECSSHLIYETDAALEGI